MGLFRRGARVDVGAIAERMRPAVAAWFNGHIQILRQADAARVGRDPRTGERAGSVPTDLQVIYDSGEQGALIQPVRAAAPVTVATAATNIQAVRFQVLRTPALLEVRDGMLVRVVDGGEDGMLEDLVFALKGQPGTSMQWHGILEATLVTGNRWG